jgi:polyhydroxybutyrate depolymerase
MLRTIRTVCIFGCLLLGAASRHVAAELKQLTLQVDGRERTAQAYFPEAVAPSGSPLVFVFHGHGGSAQNVVKGFAIHEHWPEAICISMQGLPTPSKLDPEGKESGWQRVVGEVGDRDLKFFDATLAQLRMQHKIDERRIYATGFSNGGYFTYLLWAARGDVLAAVAPCAGLAADNFKSLKPKPCLHIAGRKDQVIPFEYQQQTMAAIRRLNGCDETGQVWNPGPKIVVTLYPSPTGTPFVSAIHIGGHILPRSTGAWIVRFFKEQSKP